MMATRAEVVWRACAIMVAHRRAREHMRECIAPCCAEPAAHSRCAEQRNATHACAHTPIRLCYAPVKRQGRESKQTQFAEPPRNERACMRAVNKSQRQRQSCESGDAQFAVSGRQVGARPAAAAIEAAAAVGER